METVILEKISTKCEKTVTTRLKYREESEIIINIEKINDRDKLRELPENISMFKCSHCRYIFDIFEPQCAPVLTILSDRKDIICPSCGMGGADLICKVDGYSTFLKINDVVSCRKGIAISGVDLCPVCGEPMCPECYNHSVVSLSRVTGYIQDISGWNVAKRQELLDRKRYDIGKQGETKTARNKTEKIEENIEKFDREFKNRFLREGQLNLTYAYT